MPAARHTVSQARKWEVMGARRRHRFVTVLAVVVVLCGLGASAPGLAGARGVASHFFTPAVQYNGQWLRAKPRLVTVKQTQGYTVRYSVSYWTHYGHLSATAVARAYVNGRSFPVRLTFHHPRRVAMRSGETWWAYARLTVNNYQQSYADTGYTGLLR